MKGPTATNWSYPTEIRFGPGRIAELAQACTAAGITRPLLVTDPGLAKLPPVQRALDVCDGAGVPAGLFGEVEANPTGASVEAGVAALRAGGHDGVIAMGGGSALDCGKAVAFAHGQTRPLWDFEDIGDYWTRADADAILPVIAVPTTAGTGSEVGRASVITRTDTASGAHEKKIIFHPKMLPVTVIADAQLSVGMPPAITAGTGMDALAHSLEAYCAPTYHPMSTGIAVEGMRLVKDNLERAYADGADVDARGNLLSAAAMGAVAFQKGLGAIHSLSHPLGAVYGTHHGTTNAVFMPYVLAFNRKAVEADIALLAGSLGIGGGYAGFVDWTLRLRETLGIPHTLDGLGVDDARFDEMAEMAVVDPTAGTNPVPLDVAGARGLLEAAASGTV